MRVPVEQQVQESLEKLYDSLPPEVAAEVRRKNDLDAEKFAEAASEWTPSQDLAYWAKKNCNDCYGRGYCGIEVNKGPVKCRCTNQNYQKWLVEFRRFWNALRKIAKSEGFKDV